MNTRTRFQNDWLRSSTALLIGLALLKIIVHLLVNGQYGFFRDELSYIDDGKHLAWGYVDHPPLTPLLAAISRVVFGVTSLVGLRVWPALASAGIMLLTGLMVRQLGGGRFAQGLGALCVLISPTFLMTGVMFQAVPYDQLFWVLAIYFIVLLLKTEDPRYWIGIGAAIGLGMMTKYTMLFFGVSLAAGILLTSARRYLRSPWLWAGVGVALLIMLPNILWQFNHDWISLDYTHSINERDIERGRADGFVPEQFLNINFLTLPIVLAGLYFYFSSQGQRYRVLGWIFVSALILFLVMKGRFYYLAPAYPMLMAAGAVVTEQHFKYKRALVVALVIAGLLMVVPSRPVVPVDSDLWKDVVELNDSFPEMIGWEELVETVAGVRAALPPGEKVAIFAANYGEAGAINLYGERYDLPEAISPVNTHRYWSEGRVDADVYIVLGISQSGAENWFNEVAPAARITNRYDVENEEQDYPVIFVCRSPKIPLSQLWDDLDEWFG